MATLDPSLPADPAPIVSAELCNQWKGERPREP
jgi:hypothetical protein